MRLRMHECPWSMACIEQFHASMFLKDTERMTERGLETSPNPAGIDLFLGWLDGKCHHPDKEAICKHIRTLKPMGVIIPNDVLNMIGRWSGR